MSFFRAPDEQEKTPVDRAGFSYLENQVIGDLHEAEEMRRRERRLMAVVTVAWFLTFGAAILVYVFSGAARS